MFMLYIILLVYNINVKLHLKLTLENHGSFLLVCFIFEQGSHCSPDWPGSLSMPKWSQTCRHPPISASQVLGL